MLLSETDPFNLTSFFEIFANEIADNANDPKLAEAVDDMILKKLF